MARSERRFAGEGLLLDGEGDRARLSQRAGSAGYGDGVGSRRGTGSGDGSAGGTTTTAAACQHAAAECYEEQEHTEDGSPAATACRNTEEE